MCQIIRPAVFANPRPVVEGLAPPAGPDSAEVIDLAERRAARDASTARSAAPWIGMWLGGQPLAIALDLPAQPALKAEAPRKTHDTARGDGGGFDQAAVVIPFLPRRRNQRGA
ncbi:MAG: hypothetical protein AAGC57_05880 [Pseudomonadota bacterium]